MFLALFMIIIKGEKNMVRFSEMIVPFFVLFILLYGFKKRVNLYDSFLVGAKNGLITIFHIAPAVIGMVFATNLFLKSQFLEFLFSFLTPLLCRAHIPIEVLSMALVRPISGTASLAIMNSIFRDFGPDSFVGRLASTLQGCTDTTIYVLALYFGSIKVTKTRHALRAGLFADMVGIIAAFLITLLFFG